MTLTSQRQGANFNLRWFGINGVSYQPLSSTNLVDWLPCEVPLPGTNGVMSVLVPIGSEPIKFFRFSATY